MGNLRVIHSSTASATPAQARDARARAWKFIFEAYYAKRKGGVPSTADDAMKGSKHDRANSRLS